jgi:hypothetical protein
MKQSKKCIDWNKQRLYGSYIEYFAKIQKVYTFEMYLKTRKQLMILQKQGKI